MTKFAWLPVFFAAAIGIASAAPSSDDPRACDHEWARMHWRSAVVHCHDAQKEAWAAGETYKAAFYEAREAYAYAQLHRDTDAREALREARDRANSAGAAGLLRTLNDPNFFSLNPSSILNNP